MRFDAFPLDTQVRSGARSQGTGRQIYSYISLFRFSDLQISSWILLLRPHQDGIQTDKQSPGVTSQCGVCVDMNYSLMKVCQDGQLCSAGLQCGYHSARRVRLYIRLRGAGQL